MSVHAIFSADSYCRGRRHADTPTACVGGATRQGTARGCAARALALRSHRRRVVTQRREGVQNARKLHTTYTQTVLLLLCTCAVCVYMWHTSARGDGRRRYSAVCLWVTCVQRSLAGRQAYRAHTAATFGRIVLATRTNVGRREWRAGGPGARVSVCCGGRASVCASV